VLQLDGIEVKHIDRHDFSDWRRQPAASGRRRHSVFGRELDVAARLDELL